MEVLIVSPSDSFPWKYEVKFLPNMYFAQSLWFTFEEPK